MSRLNTIWKKRPTTEIKVLGNDAIGTIEIPKTGILQAEKEEMDRLRSEIPNFQQKIKALAVKIAEIEGMTVTSAYKLVQDSEFKGWEDVRAKYLPELQEIWTEFTFYQGKLASLATKLLLQNRLLNKTQHTESLAVATSAIQSVISQVLLTTHNEVKQWAAKNNIIVPASDLTRFFKKLENTLLEEYEIITEQEIGELPAELVEEFYEFFKKEEQIGGEELPQNDAKTIPTEEEIREGAEEGKDSKSKSPTGKKSSGG